MATGVAAVAALLFTQQSIQATRDQLAIAERGQVSDRFGRAVEQLGAKSLDVRLGGIYALEQLMRDSRKDQPTVIEVLSAYVRTHSPAARTRPLADRQPTKVPARLDTDIQAALTVLGRRNPAHDDLTGSGRHGRIDLTDTDLTGANLNRADLTDASLSGADLRNASLIHADLRDADLTGADLRDASLSGADLRNARLYRADLRNASPSGADLRNVDLIGTDLTGADLTGTNLTDADLTGAHLDNARLYRADLTGANLGGTDLRSANLRSANLGDADLRSANLGGTDLRSANLGGTDLRNANLGGADLRNAILTCTHVDDGTTLPTGVRVPPPPKEGCPLW